MCRKACLSDPAKVQECESGKKRNVSAVASNMQLESYNLSMRLLSRPRAGPSDTHAQQGSPEFCCKKEAHETPKLIDVEVCVPKTIPKPDEPSLKSTAPDLKQLAKTGPSRLRFFQDYQAFTTVAWDSGPAIGAWLRVAKANTTRSSSREDLE